MNREIAALAAAATAPVFAAPGQPNLAPGFYADGKAFGTKGTTVLPAPNDHDRQSFGALYVVTNSNNPEPQLPISEAGPGNPDYNGGRWYTHSVEWTQQAFVNHGDFVPILASYAALQTHANLSRLVITPGSLPGSVSFALRAGVY